MNSKKPLYVIRFCEDRSFYSSKVHWKGTTRENASEMNHKDATKVANKLKAVSIGMPCEVIPVENN